MLSNAIAGANALGKDVLPLDGTEQAIDLLQLEEIEPGFKYSNISIINHGTAGVIDMNGDYLFTPGTSLLPDLIAELRRESDNENSKGLYLLKIIGCEIAANQAGLDLLKAIAVGADIAVEAYDKTIIDDAYGRWWAPRDAKKWVALPDGTLYSLPA